VLFYHQCIRKKFSDPALNVRRALYNVEDKYTNLGLTKQSASTKNLVNNYFVLPTDDKKKNRDRDRHTAAFKSFSHDRKAEKESPKKNLVSPSKKQDSEYQISAFHEEYSTKPNPESSHLYRKLLDMLHSPAKEVTSVNIKSKNKGGGSTGRQHLHQNKCWEEHISPH